MSICQNNEFFCLYIDGELKQPYKSQFQKHLKECKDCAKKLQHLQDIHALFQKDKDSIRLSPIDMQKDYNTLLFQLRYKKNTTPQKRFSYDTLKYMAVAAVFAFLLPFSLQLAKTKAQQSLPVSLPIEKSIENTNTQNHLFTSFEKYNDVYPPRFNSTQYRFLQDNIAPVATFAPPSFSANAQKNDMPYTMPAMLKEQDKNLLLLPPVTIDIDAPYSQFSRPELLKDVSITVFLDMDLPKSLLEDGKITTQQILQNIKENITSVDFFSPQFQQKDATPTLVPVSLE